jgi:hypothetical protein
MDLVGPLPTAQGNYKYAVVAVEYFTKWIEAKPLVNITSEAVRKFFWQNIICRFEVPKDLTVDNGKQFDSDLFKQFCHNIGTNVMFASFYHSQSNGPVERANCLIFSSIKKCLFDQKSGKWADELPKVVWSHSTSKSRTTRFIGGTSSKGILTMSAWPRVGIFTSDVYQNTTQSIISPPSIAPSKQAPTPSSLQQHQPPS